MLKRDGNPLKSLFVAFTTTIFVSKTVRFYMPLTCDGNSTYQRCCLTFTAGAAFETRVMCLARGLEAAMT